MKSIVPVFLILVAFNRCALAQEVSIPDAGLSAAIRVSLQKPTGPLTQADLLTLTTLDAEGRNVENLAGLEFARNLVSLNLRSNALANVIVPNTLTKLTNLDVSANLLTHAQIPVTSSNLIALRLSSNALTNFTVPVGLGNLTALNLEGNRLTQIIIAPDLSSLEKIDLSGNQLTNIALPSGLAHLTQLDLANNPLASITLPLDMMALTELSYSSNLLTSLVLPEPLASGSLSGIVTNLQNQGIPVFPYPLNISLERLRRPAGAFQFGVLGPPGVYAVTASLDLKVWTNMSFVTNTLGALNFTDTTAHESTTKFYTVSRLNPPTNMMFIPPTTYAMGSSTTEQDHAANETPQTIVTLSRGFWIGKYEVTEAEYLSVTGTNPSQFPSDVSRPISSVSWQDATNYCAILTERELAAGRIAPGSRFRLPTEAEWECAARAGTTTRFSYGDDPFYTELPNYAWQNFEDGLVVHRVGLKLPNPWGLYDMMGNVFEWTQDWLGPYPGGSVTDPQGPPSNEIGWKVIRGGAFDFGGSACRSASRSVYGNHPALNDWNLGFRVVLASD